MSDGSVVVDEERATKKAKVAMTNSLDGRMLAVLVAVVAKTAVSEEQRKAQLAETALEQLRHYILFHGHCLEAFLYEAFVNTSSGAPPPELVDAIQDVGGLDAVISTYCGDQYLLFFPRKFQSDPGGIWNSETAFPSHAFAPGQVAQRSGEILRRPGPGRQEEKSSSSLWKRQCLRSYRGNHHCSRVLSAADLCTS